MNKFLLDTVIYIDFFRADRYQEWVLARPARIYLSSIVLLELYTGAHDAAQIQWIDNHLRLPFRARERIVSPMVNDYTRAGQILAELQRTKGYDLRKSYGLQNDVLIALTARRIGATVITKNRRDYEEIQAIRSFSLHVVS